MPPKNVVHSHPSQRFEIPGERVIKGENFIGSLETSGPLNSLHGFLFVGNSSETNMNEIIVVLRMPS